MIIPKISTFTWAIASLFVIATPTPAAPAPEIQLGKLTPTSASQEWGQLQTDRSVSGKPLVIAGQRFAHGLGTHASGQIVYDLAGDYATFKASVGVDEAMRSDPEAPKASVVFQVYADGIKVFDSGVMKMGEKAKPVEVNVSGVNELKLLSSDAGDGKACDHADWANAVLVRDARGISAEARYPGASDLTASPGATTYFVDPVRGNDDHDGKSSRQAWKSFAKINALRLAPGDTVTVAPGSHPYSLKPTARGTAENPVRIRFLPGLHEFSSGKAYRRPWFVSNTADHCFRPKPCGILIEKSQHLLVEGAGVKGKDRTTVMMSGPGRMVKVINHLAEDITYQGLVFDLKRPAVSEIFVLEVEANSAVVQVAQGSTYQITGGKFAWTGDLGDGWVMSQESNLETRQARRKDHWNPFNGATASDLGSGKIRLNYASGNAGLVKGRAYGFRHILHDSLSIHNARSKDIVFRDCEINAMTNMSTVSQFTENVTFQRVNVVPPPGDTYRFTPSVMDVFHFANCRGQVLIDSCIVSGAGDDGVNYHGIHLGIAGKPAANQLLVRFLQQQTYGFAPYAPGDEVAIINHNTLREHPNNPRRKVTAVSLDPNDATRKNWIITLDGAAPAFNPGDVVDNITWQADVTIRDCKIELASCRGILATSRGKIIIEGNTINSTMPGVLIENDANFWWESSCVRDLTIRNNTFLSCGIDIAPQTIKPDGTVHENIRIENNTFTGEAGANHYRGKCPFITANGVKGLTITGNRHPGGELTAISRCEDVKAEGNPTDIGPNPGITAAFRTPEPGYGTGGGWEGRHKAVLEANQRIKPEIVMMGDSITHLWGGEPVYPAKNGAVSWAAIFKDRPVVNMGFGSDCTQHLLWRIENGELDGIEPKRVVLLIGTNNLGGQPNCCRAMTPAETVAGIRACVAKIREKQPKAKVLVMGLLPRSDQNGRFLPLILETNTELARLMREDKTDFLDLSAKFMKNGTTDDTLFTDGVHPNAQGYEIWRAALQPIFAADQAGQ